MKSFAERVIAWQRASGRRDLPWQNTRDPYRIWLSEIMLQQTQVSAVVPYYARVLARFHEHHPDITLTVLERHSDDLAEQLENGFLDLALAILPMRRGALEHTVLAVEELVVMVAVDHPLADQGDVRLEQLRDVPLIMFREGYNLRSATLGAFERAGFSPRVALDGAEISSVTALVRAGIGVAIVPGIVAGHDPYVTVLSLAAPRLERAIGLVRPTLRPPSRSALALESEIISFLVSGEWHHEGAVGFRLAPRIGS